VLPDDRQLALELRAVDSKRAHVGSNDVFADVAIHLDDDWPWQSGPRHDEVVAFDPRLNASQQTTDVTKFR
jgi:hypothetical protein